VLYISTRAKLGNVLVSDTTVVLGPSIVGDSSVLDNNVIVGYPVRAKIREIKGKTGTGLNELLDKVSSGSIIGREVHLRPGTTIYEDTRLNDGVETGHNVLIRENVIVGESSIIGSSSVIDGRVRIGSRVRIESGVYIPPESVVEDNVFIGPYAVVTNDRYPMSEKLIGVYIERNAVIGANSVLIAGIRVGENSVVAAGSVVTRDVPANTVVAGVPARPVSARDKYDEKKALWEKGVIRTWMQ
jgi:acetyltransferase-like isoleucine patch superfamily enzyme